jgi:hypothetical protein
VAPVTWMLLTVATAGITVGTFSVLVAGVRGTDRRKGLREPCRAGHAFACPVLSVYAASRGMHPAATNPEVSQPVTARSDATRALITNSYLTD